MEINTEVQEKKLNIKLKDIAEALGDTEWKEEDRMMISIDKKTGENLNEVKMSSWLLTNLSLLKEDWVLVGEIEV